MDVSEIIRSARVAAHLDQRALAKAAGISPGSLGDLESGRRKPSWATLCLLLQVCGLELALVKPGPALTDRQRRFLGLSTSDRLYLSLGGTSNPRHVDDCEPWRQLSELTLRHGRISLPASAAVGVWVEGVRAPDTLPVHWHGDGDLPEGFDRLAVTSDPLAPAEHLIPVGTRFGSVRVPTPVALALDVDAAVHARTLRAISCYLHVEEGYDDARRRRPAHRWSDPEGEASELQERHGYGRLREVPTSLDRREWRARSVVSFAQWLSIHRYADPRTRPRRRATRLTG